MNIQEPESLLYTKTGLEIYDIFGTIQCEGPFIGHSAIFICLAGCNLKCSMCDTDYTSKREFLTNEKIFSIVKEKFPLCWLIVVTGGEPFRQNIQPLISLLLDNHYLVQIETNGTLYQRLPYYNISLYIGCSPKTSSINKMIQPKINYYKYILDHRHIDEHDGLPIRSLGHPSRINVARPQKDFTGSIFVQPEYTESIVEYKKNLDVAVSSVMKFGYRLSLQINNIIGVN